MIYLYKFLSVTHVVIGFVSLVLFWIPIIARKGSPIHKQTGHWYAYAMYFVAGSAAILSALLIYDPIAVKFAGRQFTEAQVASVTKQVAMQGLFLLAISILVMSSVRHGLLTLKAKREPQLIRQPSHILLLLALVTVGVTLAVLANGAAEQRTLYYIFAGICTFNGVASLRFCLKQSIEKYEWVVQHLGGMIGAGIGSYTAFFVFGGTRYLEGVLTGYLSIIPWVAPAIVGTLIIAYQSRKYTPKRAKS